MASTVRFLSFALAFLGVAQAAPGLVPIASVDVATKPNGYIVQLKPNARRGAHRAILNSFSAVDSEITYDWPNLNAFAGTFSDEAILALRQSSEVEAIELDTIGGVDAIVTQSDAPWGLQRISQAAKLNRTATGALDYTYTFDDTAGAGVDVYVVDTGINTNHTEFEGRASWGATFGGYTPDVDGYGHGTHVAGTVASRRYGVAKKANVIAVRVLDQNGSGVVSDTIAAVNWAVEQATTVTFRPSVITISLRFSPSDILDAAVTNAINSGVHVTASAGNASTLSSTQSPARAAAIITVGATDINDAKASYSNYGPGVDIYGPGSNVLSTYIGSNTASASLSGTSMATPHLAGLVAYLVGLEGNKPTAEILARLKEFSPDGILTAIPAGTNNELANNGANL